MDFYIVIPVHNEEAFIGKMLQSVVEQTVLPKQVVVVDDSSTDRSREVIQKYSEKHPFITYVAHDSKKIHEPGSKVVEAFYKGFKTLDSNFDLIGKFDADLILPSDYFEKTLTLFASDEKVGIAGGNLYIEKEGQWEFENISEKTKVRGPIKLYRKACFEAIGGLKKSIGWDTVDGLLAEYHGWKIKTDTSLHVKHLKPTGKVYTKASKHKQGEAFYRMRYGFWLSSIASAKLAMGRKNVGYFFDCMKGYRLAKKQNLPFIVTQKEGEFIRNLRWKNIKSKMGFPF